MRPTAVVLLVLGLAQMTGDVTGVMSLKGLAAATAASPAPKVFSSVRGLETYSSRFSLEWADIDGKAHVLALDPKSGARLEGPYNRRNVYGAVLAYGPVLIADERTRPMFEAVARHALCAKAPVLRELGIEPQSVSGRLSVVLDPLNRELPPDMPSRWEAPCR